MPSLDILVDENVPLAGQIFAEFGHVRTLSGDRITREDVSNTDVLVVRSVTQVNSELLGGSNVQFVGSATVGTDHIETEFLHQRGTAFAHAPGSNADSVVEYVVAALFRTASRLNYSLTGRNVGVIGCGNIGGRVASRLTQLGLAVIKNDPPLAEKADGEGRDHDFRPLDEVISESDIITLHVPLVRSGDHPTAHLIDEARLSSMKAGSWLINTSRGPVVHNSALRKVLSTSDLGPEVAVLDVWEGEPAPMRELITMAALATPHIAGYSYDGKVAGTLMIAEALARHLGRPMPDVEQDLLRPIKQPLTAPDPTLPFVDWIDGLVGQMYDVGADDHRLRAAASLPEAERAQRFRSLRRDYPTRRTFGAHRIEDSLVPEAHMRAVRDGIQTKIMHSTYDSRRSADR